MAAAIQQPISDHSVDHDVSVICKAASDPLRTSVIRALAKDSFGVQELAKIFSMPQPGMSHHLKILSTSGLLTSHRQGNSIFYRRTMLGGQKSIDSFTEALFRAIDAQAIPDDTLERINQIHDERSAQSRHFFEKNSTRFQEKQGHICEWDEYSTDFLDILKCVPDVKVKSVLEVGPGRGQLLSELTGMFNKVVAIDNSEKMLDLAREFVAKTSANIEFISQPLENFPTANFDVVILNMVLHHMPSPAGTFKKLSQVVAKHGFVVVADLGIHDQDWAKDSCGDVWLGFAPEEIENWAKAAGFTEMRSQYLGLRNGFQIQIKLFQHR
jgi:2-polyprenyl-3-methyl-5-hydroxy-6-metoxy-1,4-benzoquinol methylase